MLPHLNGFLTSGQLALPLFQGAQPDHMWVESSSCCFPRELLIFVRPRELVSFDPWHMTRSPPIGKHIWVGRYNNGYYPPVRLKWTKRKGLQGEWDLRSNNSQSGWNKNKFVKLLIRSPVCLAEHQKEDHQYPEKQKNNEFYNILSLEHKHKHKTNKTFCSACVCAYASVVDILTSVILMFVT